MTPYSFGCVDLKNNFFLQLRIFPGFWNNLNLDFFFTNSFFCKFFSKFVNILFSCVSPSNKYKLCDQCLRKLNKKLLSLLRVLGENFTLRPSRGTCHFYGSILIVVWGNNDKFWANIYLSKYNPKPVPTWNLRLLCALHNQNQIIDTTGMHSTLHPWYGHEWVLTDASKRRASAVMDVLLESDVVQFILSLKTAKKTYETCKTPFIFPLNRIFLWMIIWKDWGITCV